MERACVFLKDLACSFPRLPDPVEQFDVSHQVQLVWWQEALGWKCHDAERDSR